MRVLAIILLVAHTAAADPIGVRFDGAGGAQIVAIGFAGDALYVAGNFRGALAAGDKKIKTASKDEGYQQLFVARIERSGKVGYLTRIGGGPDPGELDGMAVAPDGTVAVIGGFDIGKDHGMAAHMIHEGTVIVVGPDGKQKWERRLATSDRAMPRAVAFARDGSIYVCGGFAAATTFGTQKLTTTPGKYVPSVDIFLARYTPAGKVAWVATGGSREDDVATALAVLPSGDVAIAGYIEGATTLGKLALAGPKRSTQLANPSHGFLAIARPTGELRAAEEFGTHDTMQVPLLAATADGTLVLAGDDEGDIPNRAQHPFVARYGDDAKLLGRRDVDTIAAVSAVDDALLVVAVAKNRIAIERHDGARTGEAAAFTRAATAKLEPIALARAADGRTALAAVVGDFIETPVGGGVVSVSSDAIDSVVVIGVLDSLGTAAELR